MGPNRISELAAGAMAQTKGLAMPMKEAVGADVEVRAAMATAMTVPRRELISAMAAGLIGSGHDDASSRSYCRIFEPSGPRPRIQTGTRLRTDLEVRRRFGTASGLGSVAYKPRPMPRSSPRSAVRRCASSSVPA